MPSPKRRKKQKNITPSFSKGSQNTPAAKPHLKSNLFKVFAASMISLIAVFAWRYYYNLNISKQKKDTCAGELDIFSANKDSSSASSKDQDIFTRLNRLPTAFVSGKDYNNNDYEFIFFRNLRLKCHLEHNPGFTNVLIEIGSLYKAVIDEGPYQDFFQKCFNQTSSLVQTVKEKRCNDIHADILQIVDQVKCSQQAFMGTKDTLIYSMSFTAIIIAMHNLLEWGLTIYKKYQKTNKEKVEQSLISEGNKS